MNKMTPEELEQFIHRELRGLPVRRAPSTLEGRVLAAIEHRASIAWYHQILELTGRPRCGRCFLPSSPAWQASPSRRSTCSCKGRSLN